MTIRPARPDESDAIAEIARASREHFLPYLPRLHSLEGDKRFYRTRVFAECAVWVAEAGGAPIGFCAFRTDWLEHLYLLPGHTGRSVGSALIENAKARQDRLQLWVFRANTGAIRFYARHGFAVIRETDGAGNEEKTPDVLMEWRRRA
nr:GNAT family N-acetyltransferase [Oceanicola granulosus]